MSSENAPTGTPVDPLVMRACEHNVMSSGQAPPTDPADAVVIRDVDQTYGHGVTIDLKPGMAWALYVDDGPGGPCGQSMRTTCPHSVLHVWPSEDAMRAALVDGHIGRNKKARVMYGVVDEWTSPGVFQVRIHG